MSFLELINAWNNTGISQVMVEQVDFNSTDKYGIINPGEKRICTFKSNSIMGLVEKPAPKMRHLI